MSRLAITLSLAVLVASTGCRNHQRQDQQPVVSQQQQLKPVVAIVPMVDRTVNTIPWSLSEEMTSAIYQRIAHKDNLYLVNQQKVAANQKKIHTANNPFATNIDWVKKTFKDNEFVVFLELLEHEESPVNAKKTSSLENCSAELNTSIRVRVIDLRSKEPKVILQELIHDAHYIPKQFTQTNFYQVPWGEEGFEISPLGLAHEQMTKELASRIEDYILQAAKS